MEKIFVIGDIHGCNEELKTLLAEIKKELQPEDLIVCLGDYIDRGPDSKGVVDTLIKLKNDHSNCVFLKGNHEDMFMDFLFERGHHGDVFIYNGGDTTMKSYDATDCISYRGFRESFDHDQYTPEAVFPDEHIKFFRNLEVIHVIDDYIFVHAGLQMRPDLFFAKDDYEFTGLNTADHDKMWIRQGWLGEKHSLGKTVIFGHTPTEKVMTLEDDDGFVHSIGIDTGCVFHYRIGDKDKDYKLTCLRIEDGNFSTIQVQAETLKLTKKETTNG
jgi:serine/threonine protein phosphatase 1